MTRSTPQRDLLAAAVRALLPANPVSPLTTSLIDAAVHADLPAFSLYRLLYLLLFPKRVALYLNARTSQRSSTFEALVNTANEVLFAYLINGGMLDIMAGWFVLPLKRLGVWDEYAARLTTQRTGQQIDLLPMREFVWHDASIAAALRAGHLPDDEAFCEEWEIYLDRYGQRADVELDLAVPRLRETPDKLIALLLADQASFMPRRTLIGLLCFPLACLAVELVERRERFLFYTAQSLDDLRKQFYALALHAVEREQIASPDVIWQMDQDVLRALDPPRL